MRLTAGRHLFQTTVYIPPNMMRLLGPKPNVALCYGVSACYDFLMFEQDR